MFQRQPLEIIRELIPNLPGKDSELAMKFLEQRNFEAIHELVKSDIYLVEKNAIAANPQEKYSNVSYDELVELKSELEEYMTLLEVPDNSDELEDLFYDD